MRLAQPWRSSCRLFSCIGGDSRSRVLDLEIGNSVLRLSGASSFVQHHVVPAPCGLRSRGLHLREANGSLLIHSNHYSSPASSFAAIISCKQEKHWCNSSETSLFSHKHSTMAPIPATAGGEGDRTPDDRKGFRIVVAATRSMGIGKDGQLPWKLPTDMKFFKKITSYTTSSSKKNAVIMGRNTWESIPEKFRPLPGRLNVVLSRSIKHIDSHGELIVSDSLDAALALLASPPHSTIVESVYVIGGGQVYRSAEILGPLYPFWFLVASLIAFPIYAVSGAPSSSIYSSLRTVQFLQGPCFDGGTIESQWIISPCLLVASSQEISERQCICSLLTKVDEYREKLFTSQEDHRY